MGFSGIYKIQSVIKPERIYLGSSVDLSHRWSHHKGDLRRNKHHSLRLQNHYNKYGEGDLVFSILLFCNEADLRGVEQDFLTDLKPYFNILPIAVGGISLNVGDQLTEEHKKHIGDSMRGENNPMFGVEPWIKGRYGISANKNKGRTGVYSKETLKKMSESSKRAWDIRKQKQMEDAK